MDSDIENIMLYTARQVAKSTTTAAKQATGLAALSNLKIVHVMPQHSQLRPYIYGRLEPFIRDYRKYKKQFPKFVPTNKALMDKYYKNNNSFHARVMYITADGSRGLSSDWLFFDEVQDLIARNIVVVKETAAASNHAFGYKFHYTGTPKTSSNTMEYLRKSFTNLEPMMKCPSCGHYNYIEVEGVRKDGYECIKCKKIIPPNSIEYCITSHGKDSTLSIRIPQMVTLPWDRVYAKMNDPLITPMEIHNEILALPYSIGTSPITIGKLLEISTGDWYDSYEDLQNPNIVTFAGLDPGAGSPSNTVLTIGAMFPEDNKFHVIAYFKFDSIIVTGAALKKQAMQLFQILRRYRVSNLMMDYGFGLGYLAEFDSNVYFKVISMMYAGPSQKEMLKYETENNRFIANRTQVMYRLFQDLNNNAIVLPKNSASMHTDIMHIYAETSKKGNIVYNHLPTEPDDAFHSLLYCYFMAMLYWQKLPNTKYYF